MCRIENVRSPEHASIMEVATWIATAVFVALMILTLVSGCMRLTIGQGAKLEIKAEAGSTQTVSIGDKRVNIPVSATIPAAMTGM